MPHESFDILFTLARISPAAGADEETPEYLNGSDFTLFTKLSAYFDRSCFCGADKEFQSFKGNEMQQMGLLVPLPWINGCL
jgi:hypothetical protein